MKYTNDLIRQIRSIRKIFNTELFQFSPHYEFYPLYNIILIEDIGNVLSHNLNKNEDK